MARNKHQRKKKKKKKDSFVGLQAVGTVTHLERIWTLLLSQAQTKLGVPPHCACCYQQAVLRGQILAASSCPPAGTGQRSDTSASPSHYFRVRPESTACRAACAAASWASSCIQLQQCPRAHGHAAVSQPPCPQGNCSGPIPAAARSNIFLLVEKEMWLRKLQLLSEYQHAASFCL